MCIHASEVRAQQELEVLSLLCDKCEEKVDKKLKDNETLFDYPPDAYNFCAKCIKKIIRWQEQDVD